MFKSNVFRLALLIVVLLLGYLSLFTVRETEQAIVLQFGNPKRTVTEAGLNFKIPFLQQVLYLDRRILSLDMPEQEVIVEGQERLVVDAFTRFRISDPLLTYQRVGNEAGARNRLQALMQSNMRRVLGDASFDTLLSSGRAELMVQIRDDVNTEVQDLGIQIVDVRLRRVDLPEANSNAIYQRMQTEREREAREARAQGNEQAQRIRAQAERERTVLLAEAERQAQILRGEGDAEATRIFAEAFSQDPQFFEFYRTMQAYRNGLLPDDTTMVLSPDSDFFKYFKDAEGNQ